MLTFTGKKIKEQYITIHELNIKIRGNNETAFLIKPSSQSGRKSKLNNLQGLGFGTFKFAQKAVMVLPNSDPIKFALTTQEYTNQIPDGFNWNWILNKDYDSFHLHSAVVLPKYVKTKGKLQRIIQINYYHAGKNLMKLGIKF